MRAETKAKTGVAHRGAEAWPRTEGALSAERFAARNPTGDPARRVGSQQRRLRRLQQHVPRQIRTGLAAGRLERRAETGRTQAGAEEADAGVRIHESTGARLGPRRRAVPGRPGRRLGFLLGAPDPGRGREGNGGGLGPQRALGPMPCEMPVPATPTRHLFGVQAVDTLEELMGTSRVEAIVAAGQDAAFYREGFVRLGNHVCYKSMLENMDGRDKPKAKQLQHDRQQTPGAPRNDVPPSFKQQ
ncbi:uncharacterized protein PV09_08300 [Verruconis gallopava]|uniref:Uncharacterized protein n=1 Tax=Verruconis gallopava TaxID=253628 RepID=A0A0D2A0F8_9PEZI|nr:uncharacterized protein PV09_08300 [Verruconis gallopava]KIW00118.1 hypothetical protein PV09_08300 [Verruconis gallopava]